VVGAEPEPGVERDRRRVALLHLQVGAAAAALDRPLRHPAQHMLGEPRTMQDDPRYDDVVAEVGAFLAERAETAMAAGVAREKIWLDPGIGFGKTVAHNLSLLAHLDALVDLGFPVILGASRKRFLTALDPSAKEPDQRLPGSLAAALTGAAASVAAVRVHDVAETVQALKVWAAIHA